MLKRLCLIGLTMILLASMMFQPMPSMAASGDWQSAAEYLYELGLFRGTGTSSDGTPVFELERSPTRTEGTGHAPAFDGSGAGSIELKLLTSVH